MMSLAQIAQNKKQQARTAFINAAWSEEPPERLAEPTLRRSNRQRAVQ